MVLLLFLSPFCRFHDWFLFRHQHHPRIIRGDTRLRFHFISLALSHYTLSPYKSITAHASAKFALRLKRENCVNKRWPPRAACLSSLSSCQRTLQTYKSWSVGERGGAHGHRAFNRCESDLLLFYCKFFAAWHRRARIHTQRVVVLWCCSVKLCGVWLHSNHILQALKTVFFVKGCLWK